MARLAIAGAGLALGGALGGPWGARAGLAVGSALANLLFPQKAEGPRLDDLAVGTVDYGAAIPLHLGTGPLAGQLMWVKANALIEEKAEEGGLKGGSSLTSYAYYASFAVLLCRGPIDGVRRIWADTKLIYDASGETLAADIAAGGAVRALAHYEGVSIRVYPGSETQVPDPAIEAEQGAGRTPAFRGIAYVVLERLPLRDFGNRIPTLRAEVVNNGATSYPRQALTTSLGVDSDAGNAQQIDQPFLYLRRTQPSRLVKLDLDSGLEVAAHDYTGELDGDGNEIAFALAGDWAPVSVRNRYLFVPGRRFLSGAAVYRFHADSLVYLDHIGRRGSAASPFYEPLYLVVRSTAPPPSAPQPAAAPFTFRRVLGVLETSGKVHLYDADTLSALVEPVTLSGVATLDARHLDIAPEEQAVWVVASNSAAPYTRLHRLAIGAAVSDAGTYTWVLEESAVYDLTGELAGTGEAVHYDREQGLLLVAGSAGSGHLLKLDPATGSLLGKLENVTNDGAKAALHAGPRAGRLWLERSGTLHEIDVVSMTRLRSIAAGNWGVSPFAVTLDQDHAALLAATPDGFQRLFLPRLDGADVALAEAITTLATESGELSAADLDVSAVSDSLRGYSVTRQTSAETALAELLAVHFVDASLADGKLVFVPRGQAPSASLAWDDLGAGETQPAAAPLIETRRDDKELPEVLSLVYPDQDADYEPATQRARRQREAVASREPLSAQTTVVMDAGKAATVAQRLLWSAWAERVEATWQTDLTYSALVPTDVVTLPFAEAGEARAVRLTEVDSGPFLRFKGTLQDPEVYSLTSEGAPPSGRQRQFIARLAETELFLIDANALRDQDAGDEGFYLAVAPRLAQAAWGGAAVFRSSDGAAWSEWESFERAAAWGHAVTRLPDAPPEIWDRGSTLDVLMVGATLSAATEAEVLNGANPLLVEAAGGWELLHFASATDLGGGRWRLATFLRGQRGTEPFTGAHAAGNRVIVPSLETLTRRVNASEIGAERHYVAVTFGKVFDDALAEAFTNRAAGLKPYAPANLKASRNAAGDLTLTWVRRTRIGGENDWRDGVPAVPLGEAAEAYEVEILAGPGGAVLDTLTGLSSPTTTYTAAEQTAAGLAPGQPITLRVYQISAAVGRGYPTEATL